MSKLILSCHRQVNDMEFVSDRFYLSTAEEEANLFWGDFSMITNNIVHNVLLDGVYRVIDGELCRIVSGVSPKFQ